MASFCTYMARSSLIPTTVCLSIYLDPECEPKIKRKGKVAFKPLLNGKVALSQALLKPSLRLLFEKNLPERAPTKHSYVHCRFRNYVHGHIDDPPTLN